MGRGPRGSGAQGGFGMEGFRLGGGVTAGLLEATGGDSAAGMAGLSQPFQSCRDAAGRAVAGFGVGGGEKDPQGVDLGAV